MALLIFTAGGIFALFLLLNNALKAVFRKQKIGFLDLLLAFMVTLLIVTALILNHTGDAPDNNLTNWALALGAGLIIVHVLVILLEFFRPQRLKGSRGLLGVFSGALIALSTVTIPFVAAYFAFEDAPPPATTIAQVTGTPLEPTAAAEIAQRQRAASLFNGIVSVVFTEIQSADQAQVLQELEQGKPLAVVVGEHNGDLNIVRDGIAEVMRNYVRQLVSLGEMNQLQAALLLSQMDNLVVVGMQNDIRELERLFGGPTPAPGTPTSMSIISALTPSSVESLAITLEASPTLAPSLTQTPSPTVTRTPTLTRTPRPSATPFPTRQGYATRTPSPTATLVTPCLANVEYNLRVRSTPEQIDSPDNTLLVITFDTVIELYGKSQDGLWWFTAHEGVEGWVIGEFLTISSACDRLPVLDR